MPKAKQDMTQPLQNLRSVEKAATSRDDRMIPSSTSAHMESAKRERTYRRIVFDAICVAILIAYFLYFAFPAGRGGFRNDEMLNIWIYWQAGAPKSLLANLTFWTAFYRPGGALYYLPLYHFFALDPQPYRIVQISILAGSIPMVFYLARLLSLSRSVAFLAVLALCYHARLANLIFIGAFIYDVLCGFFYFAALTYYIHIRKKGLLLRPIQLLGFLALYVCALNCKEMAVTLPVIILIYEFLKAPRWADWKALFRRSWSVAAPSLIAGLLTAIYIFGKTHGSGSLIRLDPYRPKLSWHHFITSNAKFVGDLLYSPHAITPLTLLALWAVVFIYAFLRRDRTLQLMAFWIVIVPLPIAFIRPIRGGGSLYLLLFGWAMIIAKVAFDLITLISKSLILVRQTARVRTPTGAIIGGAATGRTRSAAAAPAVETAVGKTSASTFRIVAVILLALSLARFTQWENQRLRTVRAWPNAWKKVSHVIGALQSLNLQPAPRSTVLLKMKDNPFPNKWHPLFIASLFWNDHSLRIWLEDVSQLTPQQVANVDYIILLSEFEAKVIRAPRSPPAPHPARRGTVPFQSPPAFKSRA
jgi:hypothetical protein